MTTLTPEQLLERLNWRYAVKKFDPDKKIPKDLHMWREVLPSPYHTSTAIFLAPLNAIHNSTDSPIIVKGVGASTSLTVPPNAR